MKKNKSSFQAFSLMEAIVSMAVTAIVMGIIFVIFSIMSQLLLDFKKQNEVIADLNRLTYSINRDVFDNEIMNASREEILFNSYSGDTVRYELQDDVILRAQGAFVDTFHIKVNEIAVDRQVSRSRKITFNELKMKLAGDDKEIELKFYKRVYANELLKEMDKR